MTNPNQIVFLNLSEKFPKSTDCSFRTVSTCELHFKTFRFSKERGVSNG